MPNEDVFELTGQELLRPTSYVSVPCLGGRILFCAGFDLKEKRIISTIRSETPVALGGCRYSLVADLSKGFAREPYPFGNDLQIAAASLRFEVQEGEDDLLGITHEASPDQDVLFETAEGLSLALRRAVSTRALEMFISSTTGLSEHFAEAIATLIAGAERSGEEADPDQCTSIHELISIIDAYAFGRRNALPTMLGWMLMDTSDGFPIRLQRENAASPLAEAFFPSFDAMYRHFLRQKIADPEINYIRAVMRLGHAVPIIVREEGAVETPLIDERGDVEWITIDTERPPKMIGPALRKPANDAFPNSRR
jgi:hypothetical protein